MGYYFTDFVTNSSFDVFVFTNSSYMYWRVFCRLASDRSDVTYDSGNQFHDSDFTVTIYGLEPNTRYAVNVGYSNSDDGGVQWVGTQYVTTLSTPTIDIDPWSWTSSNGVATAYQTNEAYNVLMGIIPVGNFSHNVWNDFVDKVAEMRIAKIEWEWDNGSGTYLTKSDCYVVSGDTLSARVYNSVKYNIGSVRSTGIQNVSSGDIITGYHIIHLADVLNDIIESM